MVKGWGSLGTLTQESIFPNDFYTEIDVTDKVIPKSINKYSEKIENRIYGYKIAAKTLLLNSWHKISHQKWENTFPKEFVHQIWLIGEDC